VSRPARASAAPSAKAGCDIIQRAETGLVGTCSSSSFRQRSLSKQAIASERVREGLKDVLLGPAQLYEALRDKAGEKEVEKA
jgi:type I restriction enzyme R subunit